MLRRRYTENALIEAVQSSRSIRQALAKLGLSPTGANYVGIHKEIRHLQFDRWKEQGPLPSHQWR
jgi:hypothetical protein